MGFDNDCILNIQSLSGEYFCAVCRLLVYPNEALQAPCTHLFCKPCLTYVVSTNHACPYDGYRVTEADSKPLLESNKTLADTIGKIQVHCLYYRTGCTWQGSLSDCTSHCSTCAFGESPVLCNRCGVQLVHRQVQEHAQTCPGVQSQGQQPTATQGAATTGSDQSNTAAQTGAPASQGQVSQGTSAPVASQVANQPANLATQTQATQPNAAQPQAAQAAVPSADQWYQQQYQQQYQQYYQQYPGYDPYQQQYQYYYGYPQGAQQYQQQPVQAYAQPQPQLQPQSQLPVHPQVQPQPQTHPQQPQQPSQAPSAGQPQSQPQAQAVTNVPPQAQSHVQTSGPQTTPYAQPQAQAAQQFAQPQAQAAQQYAQLQGQATQQYAQPHLQAQAPQPYAQNQQQAKPAQPYTHPQQHPVPHQQMQPPQMQQPHPQVHPHPQPYPQSQTQNYPYPQNQAQLQTPPQPNPQVAYPPSQPNQPGVPGPQPQAQNAVTGFQSFPQQQHPQAQGGAAPQMHPTGVHQQPQYAGQIHGQFPSQPSQMRPPQPYPAAPTQHPAMGPPAQQLPGYPPAQQPGYGVPQRPGIQAAQPAVPQQHVQKQQSFPGQAPFMQPQLHAHGPSQIQPQFQQNYAAPPGAHPNMAQNYAGRPMVPQGAVSQSHGQAPGLASAGQVRPAQPNQAYPMKANDHRGASEQPVHPQQLSKTVDAEKPIDQTPDKAIKGGETTSGNGGKKDASLELGNKPPGSEQGRGIESKPVGDNGQGQPRLKGNAVDGVSASSVPTSAAEGMKEANLMDSKHAVKGNVVPQGHPNDQGRSPMQSMQSGPSAQARPGVPSMPHGMPHPGNMQQPPLPAHPTNQLRPQGPGEPFGRPFPAQHPGSFDSHGVIGREAFPRTDVIEPRPPYPPENEKFPPPRMGYFDDRHPDPHFRGPVEGASHGNIPPRQSGLSKHSGPAGHETMNGLRLHDERLKPFSEEHHKSFPHREFGDDLRKYPRPPSHLEAGSSDFGGRFPSSGPLDRGPHMLDSDGPTRPFDKGPRGFERDSGMKMDPGFVPGPSRLPPFHPNDGGSERGAAFPDDNMGRSDFGRHPRFDGLLSQSPGGDHTGFPPRTFGGFRDIDRSESRSFEGPKPYNFPAEPFGKSVHESRFPVPPNRLLDHMGEGNNNQDMPPSHFRRGEHMGPRGLHLRDGAAFGLSGRQMGEPPIGEHLPPHGPFGESFGSEKPRHLMGDPGFRSSFGYQHHARDGGFSGGDLEPFDNLRKRKLGGLMCLLCQVECGTIEGLDLHAQSRDHQRKAMDIAINIKQQNKKLQKKAFDQGSGGGGRGGSKSKASFDRRGNKR